MEQIRKNWSIIRWILGALLAAVTWYFSVNFKLEQTNVKLDTVDQKVEINTKSIIHLEERIDSKHDLLLELKFNLRNFMKASGQEYTELNDFKEK